MEQYSPMRVGLGLAPIYPNAPFVYLSNESLFALATSKFTPPSLMRELAIYLMQLVYSTEYAEWRVGANVISTY